MKLETKVCKKCGIEFPLSEFPIKKGYRAGSCKNCHNKAQKEYREKHPEYKSDYQTMRASLNKVKSVLYLGDKCKVCGKQFDSCVYDFHHLDPNTKDVDPSRLMSRSWENIKPELDKCVLLCANCHRLVHHGGLQLESDN